MKYIPYRKFNASKSFSPNKIKKVRFKKTRITTRPYDKPLSYKDGIIYDGNCIHDAFDFLIKIESNAVLVVLTNKECWHIRKLLFELNSNLIVRSLEKDFPIFNNIKNLDIKNNFNFLLKKLNHINRLGLERVKLSTQLYLKYNKKIAREVKTKNSLDHEFSKVTLNSYSETFFLAETRKEKKVYCLDFNSMYLSCMCEKFTDFNSLKIKEYDNILLSSEDISGLKNGIFNVVLSNAKSEFIKRFHPFKLEFISQSLSYNLSSSDKLDAVLTLDDLQYLSHHFQEIRLKQSITSTNSIRHPLLNQAKYIANKRINNRNSNLWKVHSSLIHTASISKVRVQKVFSRLEDVLIFVRQKVLKHKECISDFQLLELIKNDYKLILTQKNDKFYLTYPGYDDEKSILSLYEEVVSKARIKLLRLIEKLYEIEGCQICYANIDSVHVSVLADKVSHFESEISNLVTSRDGGLKIEAIGDEGYWLGLGRYWIFNKGDLVKYANATFNINSNSSPFSEKLTYTVLKNSLGLHASSYKTVCLGSSLSATSKICKNIDIGCIKYERFEKPVHSWEISDLKKEEKYLTKNLKKDLFDSFKR